MSLFRSSRVIEVGILLALILAALALDGQRQRPPPKETVQELVAQALSEQATLAEATVAASEEAPSAPAVPLSAAVAPSTETMAPTPRITRPAPSSPHRALRLRIPDIGVDAPLVAIGMEQDGTLGAPNGPEVVGWLAQGIQPGARGNVLMDGHVDWAGPPPQAAVFWRLRELLPGQTVQIIQGDEEYTYAVRENLTFRFDDPAALPFLKLASARFLVTLITCAGTFDRAAQNYDQRRIVVAELVSSPSL